MMDVTLEPLDSITEASDMYSWNLDSPIEIIEPFELPSDPQDDLDDEEDGEEDGDSHSLSSHHTHASMFQQKGAIRKAGWLHVKSMLVQRKKRVERPGNRSWKKYWGESILYCNLVFRAWQYSSNMTGAEKGDC